MRKDLRQCEDKKFGLRVKAITIVMAFLMLSQAHAAQFILASWYSVKSLKDEGTYQKSKGVCADGSIFSDDRMSCACNLYPLGSILRVTNLSTGFSVDVVNTDHISKRFSKTRIDLSKGAFSKIADLEQGLVKVSVERIK